jgi:hypothetical protein
MFINTTDGRLPLDSATRSADAATLRGEVEVCGANGISGWALDLADLERSLTVQLLIEDTVIAECATGIRRGDIDEIMPDDAAAGFLFPPAALATLKRLAARCGDAEISLRIAGDDVLLPFAQAPAPLVAAFGAPAAPAAAPPLDLAARLEEWHAQARGQLDQPIVPPPDCLTGLIEVTAVGDDGLVWIGGWMQRQDATGAPVVLVDKQTIAAGLALAFYERDDVDPDCHGFIGVLRTAWRPRRMSDPYLYLGEEIQAELRCITPLRLITVPEFFDFFETRREACHTGHAAAFATLGQAKIDQWALDPPGAAVTARAALDIVLALPGFGCIATGWAISLLQPVETFLLKLGDHVLRCDPDTLYFKARPDVAGVFPGCEGLLPRAGFTAVFRGDLALDNLGQPLLKLVFADGTFSNQPVDPRALRQLGRAVPLEAALDLYPSLMSEAFFPAFAAAVRRQARDGHGGCRPHTVNPARRVVVLAAPDDRSALFLLFEALGQHARLGDGTGFAVIAGTGEARSIAVALFAGLQRNTPAPCSLFFVDDPEESLAALPDVLAALGARNFVYVGPDVVLTPAGWRAAAQSLTDAAAALSYFEIADPALPASPGRVTAACFGWTRIALTAWALGAPDHIGACHDESPLPAAGPETTIHPGAAWFSRLPVVTPLIAAINAAADA